MRKQSADTFIGSKESLPEGEWPLFSDAKRQISIFSAPQLGIRAIRKFAKFSQSIKSWAKVAQQSFAIFSMIDEFTFFYQ